MGRIEVAGGVHHVTAKCPSGRLLFRDVADGLRYLALLEAEVEKRAWELLTYCLMPNHLHLLLLTAQTNLGLGIKSMHERFAQEVNRRYGEWGHLFGRRYHNKIVESDAHLFGCLRYIARNPVEAGLTATAAEWRWSAHRTLAGLREPEPFVAVEHTLAYLQPDPVVARRDYRALAAKSNGELLAELRQTDPRWPATAIDDFRVPIAVVADFMGLSLGRTYAAAAKARENQRTDLWLMPTA
jgi:REP-associated tyrosine transposase